MFGILKHKKKDRPKKGDCYQCKHANCQERIREIVFEISDKMFFTTYNQNTAYDFARRLEKKIGTECTAFWPV